MHLCRHVNCLKQKLCKGHISKEALIRYLHFYFEKLEGRDLLFQVFFSVNKKRNNLKKLKQVLFFFDFEVMCSDVFDKRKALPCVKRLLFLSHRRNFLVHLLPLWFFLKLYHSEISLLVLHESWRNCTIYNSLVRSNRMLCWSSLSITVGDS